MPIEMHPTAQAHLIHIKLKLKKLASFHPWLPSDFKATLNNEDMEDLESGIEIVYCEYKKAYIEHADAFKSYLNSIRPSAPSVGDSVLNYQPKVDNLRDMARLLFREFENYHLQISIRTKKLLGPDSLPFKERLNAICGYLNIFEKNLISLSDEALEIPPSKSTFFSLGHYLSTLPERYKSTYRKTHLNTGFWGFSCINFMIKNTFKRSSREDEVNFIQTIASHSECTDHIRLGLVFVLDNKIKEKEIYGDGSQLAKLLCLAKKYTADRWACTPKDILNLGKILQLPNMQIPNELNSFLLEAYSDIPTASKKP